MQTNNGAASFDTPDDYDGVSEVSGILAGVRHEYSKAVFPLREVSGIAGRCNAAMQQCSNTVGVARDNLSKNDKLLYLL